MKRFLPLLLLLFAAIAFPAPAEAVACSGTTGVTVVVQFPDGHTEVGCAPGDPRSGFDALTAAGFQLAFVYNEGFLCRVNGQPAADPCQHTPPANAYWGYFHAQRGGSWSYSNAGGDAYDPSPGSVEGWRFQNSTTPTLPSMRPPAAVKPKPAPSRTPSLAVRPTRAANSVATPNASHSDSPTPPTRPTTSTAPAPSIDPSPSAMLANRAAGTGQTRTAPASTSRGFSWIWGIALISVLGAAAGEGP
jgi:hypothetical protein